jgi:UPF0755 protein
MKKFLSLIIVFCVLAIIALAASGIYGFTQLQPVDAQSNQKVSFTINKGQSISSIGQKLTDAKLLKSPYVFRFIVWKDKLSSKIQAGSFMLSPAMTPAEIGQELTQGTNDQWVTIPEGWRIEEISDYLVDQGFSQFDPKEFAKLTKDQEGYLFPDTYLLPKQSTAQQIYKLMRDTFDKKVTNGLAKEIEASGRPLSENMIMASIVQREGREPSQMSGIAGVLWNRLKIGMPLQADATLQYTKGYDKQSKTWWPEALAVDKESTSLFNTYKNPGLPPRPIANPGLDAIEATLNPDTHGYLYYISDRQGNIHFAKTYDEHLKLVNQYLR